MSRRVLLVLSLLLFGFAPAPLPRKQRPGEEDDLRKMQGTWVVTRYEYNGTDNVASFASDLLIRFEGNRLSFVRRENVVSTWDFVLTPGSPRALTRTLVGSSTRVARGIYRIEGDKLILCDDHGGTRPTEFDSRGGRWVIEMRRR